MRDEEDNEHTKGQMEYAPAYPYYNLSQRLLVIRDKQSIKLYAINIFNALFTEQVIEMVFTENIY